jgi:hypothetical protein
LRSGLEVLVRTQGADHYQVQRCSVSGCITPFTAASPVVDPNPVAANTTYVYRVAAVDSSGNGVSGFSIPDLATTMTFTPVQHNFVISRTHINELLTAVNLVLAAAGRPQVTWSGILPPGTPVPPLPGQPTVGVYAAHITSLRTQMDLALSALGIPTPPYTDSPTNGTPIKAIHFTELQSRTQ